MSAVAAEDRSLSRAEQSRRRILQAAAQVIAARGYANTRLTDIAEAAGIKAGSLYFHFDSKDELIEAVLRMGQEVAFDHVKAAVDALPPEATARQRLETAIKTHAAAMLTDLEGTDYAGAYVQSFGQLPAKLRQRYLREQRRYGDYWQTLFEDAQASGDIDPNADLVLLRLLVLGAVNWALNWPPGVPRPPAKIAATLSGMLFGGHGVGAVSSLAQPAT